MGDLSVHRETCARIPAPEGEFQLCAYTNSQDTKEHLALVMGKVADQEEILVRVHSECFTGDVLRSQRCDCGDQLHQAMAMIAAEERGILIYLRQEGRGIGLVDKLRAYNLQDEGYDTVEANILLGHQADERDYAIAGRILEDLRPKSICLLTNNPDKISGLRSQGVNVVDRLPLETQLNPENAEYMLAKQNRMRHILSLDREQDEQSEEGSASGDD
jgi:3,4-dihydroxy 2-butanone 4-phosphate synthase/GTP cyclohydrolase II